MSSSADITEFRIGPCKWRRTDSGWQHFIGGAWFDVDPNSPESYLLESFASAAAVATGSTSPTSSATHPVR